MKTTQANRAPDRRTRSTARRPGAAGRAGVGVSWAVLLAGGLVVLHRARLGQGAGDAAMAPAYDVLEVLRVGGLLVGWYLVVVTALAVVARLVRARRAAELVDAVSLATVRRVVDVVTGVSLVTGAVVGPVAGARVAAADAHTPPATIQRLAEPHEQQGPDGDRANGTRGLAGWPGERFDDPPATAPPTSFQPGPPAVSGEGGAPGAEDPAAILRALVPGDGPPSVASSADDPGAGTAGGGRPGPAEGSSVAPGTARDRPDDRSPPESSEGRPTSPSDVAPEATSAVVQPPGDVDAGTASSSTTSPGPSSRPAPAPRPGSASVASPPRHVVQPGDHFWAIAAQVLRAAWGRHVVEDREIVPYWRELIAANRAALVRPGDPDLILPGQELVLPTPPPAPPAPPSPTALPGAVAAPDEGATGPPTTSPSQSQPP